MTTTTDARVLGALALTALLAACSDGSDDGPDGLFDGSASFAELDGEFGRQFDVSADTYTDPSTLPDQGSATYEGVLGIYDDDEGREFGVAGQLHLDVDFDGSDPISGSVDNFVMADEQALAGSLDVSNSGINRDAADDEYSLGFDLDGTLTGVDGGPLVVDATALGDFLGDDHAHIYGDLEGQVTSNEGTSGVEGEFIGER